MSFEVAMTTEVSNEASTHLLQHFPDWCTPGRPLLCAVAAIYWEHS